MEQKSKGFIPVMLTPFRENGAIDFPGLEELIEFYLESGATGLFTNCLSSEMYHLGPDERLELTHFVVDRTNNRVPVVAAGTFEESVEEKAGFIRQMNDVGVEAVIVITGMMANEYESEEILAERMDQLFSLTGDIPLGLYECPSPYKRVISPDLLGQLVQTGRIVYHKDTSLDLASVTQKIAQGQEYQFGLYDAYMGHAVDSLKAGAAGLSCIQGNYWPEMIVWLCQHFDDEDKMDQVQEVQQFYQKHMDFMHENYPKVAKYFLQKRGLSLSLFTRQAAWPLNRKMKQDMDHLYEDFIALQEKIGLSVPYH